MSQFGVLAGILAALLAAPVAAEVPARLTDGLHTWQIDGTGNVNSCCYTMRAGKLTSSGCRLDGRRMSISTDGDCAAGPGAAQVYVRIENGEPESIWLFSSACPVSADDEIVDHGLASPAASLAWFRSVIESRDVDKDVREEALFALVQTESDAAFEYLDTLLTGR